MKRSKWILAALAIGMVIPVISLADESTPGTAAPPPATTSPGHHEHASKPAKHVVDLNKGSKEDLMRLPGVDATTADKIIAARPFKARNQLLDKKILTKQEYERIHAMLTVGHPPKEAAKK